MSITEIKAPISESLVEFEKRFKQSMRSDVPLLNKVVSYILKQKGKQIRPMFVFLSAEMCGGITDSTYNAASMIEILHTASLIHDDVVDNSTKRRGLFSLNALWKNKISVLIGDYLLSKGLLVSIDNNEFELLKIVSEVTKEMVEGELLQMEKSRYLNIDEEPYFEIIRKKTASLIASCCRAGAVSANASEEVINKMHQFGEYTGIAFQIKDDLFDFSDNNTGKPNGIDIKEKKITLPLIHMLRNLSFGERQRIFYDIRFRHNNREVIEKIIAKVNKSDGIAYATEKMIEYRNKALDILKTMPDSPARNSMEKLVIYTTERKK